MAFVVGIMCIAIALLRGGFIDNILSGYLLTGFIAGIATLITAEQMPEFFGLSVKLPGDASTLNKSIKAFQAFDTIRWIPTLITITNVAFLLLIKQLKKKHGNQKPWLRRVPEILIVVLVMILVSWSADLQLSVSSKGVHVLGSFSNKFEAPRLPLLDGGLMGRLVQPSLTVLLIGYIECQTATRNFGLKTSAVVGGYTVFGSITRSRIIANAGATTTIANVIGALVVLVLVVGLVPVLQFLPKATLSSIVFVAALSLIEVKEIAFVFRCRSWPEIFMFLATYLITVLTSISDGILICLGLSALLIIRRTTATSLSVLGRIRTIVPAPPPPSLLPYPSSNSPPPPPDQSSNPQYLSPPHIIDIETSSTNTTTSTTIAYSYVDLMLHPEAELLDGVILIRFNEPLLFYNSGMTRRAIEAMMMAERRIIRHKIVNNSVNNCNNGRGSNNNGNNNVSAGNNIVVKHKHRHTIGLFSKNKIGLYDADGDVTIAPVNRKRVELIKGIGGRNDGNGIETLNTSSGVGDFLVSTTGVDGMGKDESDKDNDEGDDDNYSGDDEKDGDDTPDSRSDDGENNNVNQVGTSSSNILQVRGIGIEGNNSMMIGTSTRMPPGAGGTDSIVPVPNAVTTTVNGLLAVNNPDMDVEYVCVSYEEEDHGLHAVVMDFSHCLDIDSAASYLLRGIIKEFQHQGLIVYVSGLHPFQERLFERAGIKKLLEGCIFRNVAEAVTSLEEGPGGYIWRRGGGSVVVE
ncbi:Solute carrier 26 [Blyttiomyces sp. JEL0837]|nr:Solute carrier 26 [Blyttiomyces sp. JEL0837]